MDKDDEVRLYWQWHAVPSHSKAPTLRASVAASCLYLRNSHSSLIKTAQNKTSRRKYTETYWQTIIIP